MIKNNYNSLSSIFAKDFFILIIVSFILLFSYLLGLNCISFFYGMDFNIDKNSTLHLLKAYNNWYLFFIVFSTILSILGFIYIIIFIITAIKRINKYYIENKLNNKDIKFCFRLFIVQFFIFLLFQLGIFIIYSEDLIYIQKQYKQAINNIETNNIETVEGYLMELEKDSLPGIYVKNGFTYFLNLNTYTKEETKKSQGYVAFKGLIPKKLLSDLDIPEFSYKYTLEENEIYSQRYKVQYVKIDYHNIIVSFKPI